MSWLSFQDITSTNAGQILRAICVAQRQPRAGAHADAMMGLSKRCRGPARAIRPRGTGFLTNDRRGRAAFETAGRGSAVRCHGLRSNELGAPGHDKVDLRYVTAIDMRNLLTPWPLEGRT